jgi:tetratricopeptide (TPR) repeat protein
LRGAATAAERKALGETIVNPRRLAPAQRDSVCLQCHLQPSVAFSGVRRFSRADYSFRPGEPLSDYILPVDPEEADRSRHERFEINHHPYRLMQSRCWRESSGRLSCLTCHDPHRKVPAEERAAHYRTACLSCHAPEACGRKRHGAPPSPAAQPAGEGDCVSCHMPERRTEDVVQVTMTDHFIRRREGGSSLLAPRTETDPVIRSVELFPLVGGPEGAEAELYRAVAAVRARATPRKVERLAAALRADPPAELAPWLDLARGQLQLGRLDQVEETAQSILKRAPDLAVAHEWLGLSLAGRGRLEEATEALRRSLALDDSRPESHFNLALVFLQAEPAEAAAHLERAVELRPVLVEGWYRLADAYLRLGRTDRALSALRQAVAIDPDHAAANAALRLLDAG